MHLVTLSSEARAHLVGQLDNSQLLRCGFLCAFPLDDVDDQLVDIAQVMVVPGAAEWHIWVSMAGQTLTAAIPPFGATPEHIAQVIEDHVNSCLTNTAGFTVTLIARCDLELTIKIAVLMNQGTFLIPSSELTDLYLVIEHINSRKSPDFRFVLNGLSLTLPVPLPSSEQLACKLMVSCANSIISNYRCGWGASR